MWITLDELLKASEVAKWLKVSNVTLYKLIESDDLPAFKVGGKWRFRKEAVEAWAKKREKEEHKLKKAR